MNIENWEDIPLHNMCSLFPEMNEEQYETLVADIKKNGLHDSIILYDNDAGDKFVLDGQNRRMACMDASIEPHFEYYTGDDPLGYVISKNVGRRHLTTGQLASLAAGVANMETGDNQFTHEGEVISVDKAASMFGTSQKSVQRYKSIMELDPAMAQEVARGESNLNQAYTIAKYNSDEARKAASGEPPLSTDEPLADTRTSGPDLGTEPRVPPESTSPATSEDAHANAERMEAALPTITINREDIRNLDDTSMVVTTDTGLQIRVIITGEK